MKIDIKTGETKSGLVFKKTHQEVNLFIEFSEEEKAIINANNLEDVVVLERGCPSDIDGGNFYPGNNMDFHNVTVKRLMGKDPLRHATVSKGELNTFIAQIKKKLPQLKSMIDGNAVEAEDESFEL